jgi:c-di-GMP-binding flagellar brake protein YcgR
MKVEQHRAVRHRFVARVEVVDIDSERQIVAHTSNLSVFGCFIETETPLPRGTKIRIRITHRGSTFAALGQVSNSRLAGMGVQFVKIEPAQQQVLENWLAQLRSGE